MRIIRTAKTFILVCFSMSAVWMIVSLLTQDRGDNMEENIIERAKKPRAKDLQADSGVVEENNDLYKSVPGKLTFKATEEKSELNNSLSIHHERHQEPILASLPLARDKLKQAILTINHEQTVHNKDRFPHRSDESIVILVMVHDRLEYLEYLIDSLKKAEGISDALLIFSHDYFSEDINRVIRQITFCQVMQIFYPYSLQIYQDEFPGQDPKDCPRDITPEKAKEMNCNNWEHPDTYGHYREVRYVMTKHHWFWKLQHVFSGLDATKNHNGLVLLLEEDHYMAPDFYPMLQKMYQLKKEQCPECDILTLGNYDKTFVYKDRNDKVDSLVWHSSKHNMGMSLDRKTWEELQPCVQQFCTYDDYNWDWTMNYISHKCTSSPLQVMVFKSPRVFHIGACGIHHKGKGNCSADELIRRIDSTLAANKDSLFPQKLILSPKTRPLKTKLPKPNGGWGDVRDHTLCMTYGKNVSKML